MKSFVRFCLVSVVLVALAFFCEGLRVNFFAAGDPGTAVRTSADSLTDPTRSDHSFIKFNTVCLTSPTGEGQTVTRTVTGASASPCRSARRTELDFKVLEFKTFCHPAVHNRSLPALRKLRL